MVELTFSYRTAAGGPGPAILRMRVRNGMAAEFEGNHDWLDLSFAPVSSATGSAVSFSDDPEAWARALPAAYAASPVHVEVTSDEPAPAPAFEEPGPMPEPAPIEQPAPAFEEPAEETTEMPAPFGGGLFKLEPLADATTMHAERLAAERAAEQDAPAPDPPAEPASASAPPVAPPPIQPAAVTPDSVAPADAPDLPQFDGEIEYPEPGTAQSGGSLLIRTLQGVAGDLLAPLGVALMLAGALSALGAKGNHWSQNRWGWMVLLLGAACAVVHVVAARRGSRLALRIAFIGVALALPLGVILIRFTLPTGIENAGALTGADSLVGKIGSSIALFIEGMKSAASEGLAVSAIAGAALFYFTRYARWLVLIPLYAAGAVLIKLNSPLQSWPHAAIALFAAAVCVAAAERDDLRKRFALTDAEVSNIYLAAGPLASFGVALAPLQSPAASFVGAAIALVLMLAAAWRRPSAVPVVMVFSSALTLGGLAIDQQKLVLPAVILLAGIACLIGSERLPRERHWQISAAAVALVLIAGFVMLGHGKRASALPRSMSSSSSSSPSSSAPGLKAPVEAYDAKAKLDLTDAFAAAKAYATENKGSYGSPAELANQIQERAPQLTTKVGGSAQVSAGEPGVIFVMQVDSSGTLTLATRAKTGKLWQGVAFKNGTPYISSAASIKPDSSSSSSSSSSTRSGSASQPAALNFKVRPQSRAGSNAK